jgi:hypothetical protein
MNIFSEKNKKKWYGMYRAQIIEVNTDKKNGIYKIKAYPIHAEVEDDYLPYALSNMTNIKGHENFVADDWVWVFFENGNPKFPVIFDRCNVKDQFPDGSDGEEPEWFQDIEVNSDIEESEIEWNGEYGKVWAKDLGENTHIVIDEENEMLIVKTENYWMVIDADGNFHRKSAKSFVTVEEEYNMAMDSTLIKVGENNEIKIDDDNGLDMTIGNNTIKADSEAVIINDNLKILNS